jgi:hypothetical protein
MGVSVYVLYTYAQVIIGQEYLRLPGNVERFPAAARRVHLG